MFFYTQHICKSQICWLFWFVLRRELVCEPSELPPGFFFWLFFGRAIGIFRVSPQGLVDRAAGKIFGPWLFRERMLKVTSVRDDSRWLYHRNPLP